MTREQFFRFFDVQCCNGYDRRASLLYHQSQAALKFGQLEYASQLQHEAASHYRAAMLNRIALIGRPPL